jgi:hypothetical protein
MEKIIKLWGIINFIKINEIKLAIINNLNIFYINLFFILFLENDVME